MINASSLVKIFLVLAVRFWEVELVCSRGVDTNAGPRPGATSRE